VPIAVLIWLMITPMMMKVDFSSVRNVGRRPAGLLVTLLVNWVVKPFSMALLAYGFFRFIFASFISPAEADQYIAGCIILAAAPCTAMVFVWSHLTKGDAAYTLVLIFAFQADNITGRFFHVALIAVPITLQVYFNASLTYGLMKFFKVEHAVAAPGALIGASNFFELAVATAIALYGPESGAALATVVGVLVEVPVMLSVCTACNRTRHWFPARVAEHATATG
jgi:ACR3 family arsenite efflux pump ArsB